MLTFFLTDQDRRREVIGFHETDDPVLVLENYGDTITVYLTDGTTRRYDLRAQGYQVRKIM